MKVHLYALSFFCVVQIKVPHSLPGVEELPFYEG